MKLRQVSGISDQPTQEHKLSGTEKPRFNKNWSAIAKIQDAQLRAALAALDVSNSIGKRIAGELSEYFFWGPASQQVITPLSTLRGLAAEEAKRAKSIGQLAQANIGAAEKPGIPVFYLGSVDGYGDRKAVLLPKYLEAAYDVWEILEQDNLEVGMVVVWQEKLWVIVGMGEKHEHNAEAKFTVAPFECFDLNS